MHINGFYDIVHCQEREEAIAQSVKTQYPLQRYTGVGVIGGNIDNLASIRTIEDIRRRREELRAEGRNTLKALSGQRNHRSAHVCRHPNSCKHHSHRNEQPLEGSAPGAVLLPRLSVPTPPSQVSTNNYPTVTMHFSVKDRNYQPLPYENREPYVFTEGSPKAKLIAEPAVKVTPTVAASAAQRIRSVGGPPRAPLRKGPQMPCLSVGLLSGPQKLPSG